MKKPAFSVREILRQAWALVRRQPGFLFGGFFFYVFVRGLFPALGVLILALLTRHLHHIPSNRLIAAVFLPFLAAGFVVGFGLCLGWLRGLLRLVRGEGPRWADLRSGFPVLGRGIGAAFLAGLAVLAGTFLMVLPGLYAFLCFCFCFFAVADRRLGPLDALRRSAALTKGARKEVFFLCLALLGFNLLGILFFLVGILISTPFSAAALALAHEALARRAGESHA